MSSRTDALKYYQSIVDETISNGCPDCENCQRIIRFGNAIIGTINTYTIPTKDDKIENRCLCENNCNPFKKRCKEFKNIYECPICLEKMNKKNRVYLNCSHQVCKGCINGIEMKRYYLKKDIYQITFMNDENDFFVNLKVQEQAKICDNHYELGTFYKCPLCRNESVERLDQN